MLYAMGNTRVGIPPYENCHISHEAFLRDAKDYWFHVYHPEPGDVIVDIGAGRGEDVFAFSRAVGPQGRVFAIEADPASCDILRQLCAANQLDNVTVVNLACSDQPGALRVQEESNWVSTSVDPDIDRGTGPIVEGVRFDDLRSQLSIASIDFLKMNIEGAERFALPGCAQTLEHTRYVCIAAHDFRAERGDGEEFRTLHFVIGYLRGTGFDITLRVNDQRSFVRDHVHGCNRRYRNTVSRVEVSAGNVPSREVIQGLWIGPRLSTMERLCISSFLSHGHPFHLYVYQPAEGIPPGTVVLDANQILPASQIFTYREYPTYAGFANFFRYKLLLEKGGWFVDLDTVCLKPFLFTSDYIFSSQSQEGLNGQVEVNLAAIRVPPGSDIMKWAWEECQAMDPSQLRWGESGPRLITRAVEQFGFWRYVRPPETFCPVAYMEWNRVLEPGALRKPGPETHAIHLWNEMWRRAGRDKDSRFNHGCRYEQMKQQYLPGEPSSGATPRVVVVLGMHRSGTSLCMNILSALGIRLDEDLVPGNAGNERGYFESREIMEVNESILETLGIPWHGLMPAAQNDNLFVDPALAPAKQRLISLIRERVSGNTGVWGFKDPRLCLLLPFYQELFSVCGVEPSYVLCIRNPNSVAHSLARRNQFPQLFSELMWMDHTSRVWRAAGKQLAAIVHYEDWFHSPVEQARMLCEQLKLPVPDKPLGDILDSIIVSGLDHSPVKTGQFALSCVGSQYRLLQNGDYAAAAMESVEFHQALRMGAAAVPNICQLFWRTEQQPDYAEPNSCRVPTDILPSRRVVHLPIPADERGLIGLRLDPASLSGLAHLRALRLLDSKGLAAWEWDGQAASLMACESDSITWLPDLEKHGVIAHFTNDDPRLLLPVSSELDQISGEGGVLEFEFTWLRTTQQEQG